MSIRNWLIKILVGKRSVVFNMKFINARIFFPKGSTGGLIVGCVFIGGSKIPDDLQKATIRRI